MKSCYTRLSLQERKILPLLVSLLLLIASLIIGCNVKKDKSGTSFVAARGDPPAQRIVWSPIDDNEILVTANNMGPGGEIYIFDIATKKKTSLAKTDGGSFYEAVWTPDGKSVLILAGENTQGFEPRGWWKVEISNADSHYLTDLGYIVAKWSPDGQTVVTTGGESVFLKDMSTGREVVIYTNVDPIYTFGLSWSPDGNSLVFSGGETPSVDLYITSVQTQTTVRLTENETIDQTAWSPTGNLIAFISNSYSAGISTLHLISPDGKCRVDVPNIDFALSPTWSPDGEQLAYIGIDGIYIIEIEKLLEREIYHGLCG